MTTTEQLVSRWTKYIERINKQLNEQRKAELDDLRLDLHWRFMDAVDELKDNLK